jgi:hypothetical protein
LAFLLRRRAIDRLVQSLFHRPGICIAGLGIRIAVGRAIRGFDRGPELRRERV